MSVRRQIVLGPPGTGKTTTLLRIVEEELAAGTSPDKIGYVSFTRRAAHEAIERACKKFRVDAKEFPHFSTLHSLCFKQLGMKRGDVLEGARLQEFANYVGVKITGKRSEDGSLHGYTTGDRALFMENLSRIKRVPLRQIFDADNDRLRWTDVERFAIAMRRFKSEHGLRDFTDMLDEFATSGIRVDLEVLLVDESQDLSSLQWSVVDALARECRRVVVAGDDDQAIYRWAGADVDQLIDMEGDARVLDLSYRVPAVVQSLAAGVISRVSRRREKEWRPRVGDAGEIGRALAFRKVDCDEGGTLVLARNSYVLDEHVVPVLRSRGVIYERGGGSSIKLSLIEAIRGWERLRKGGKINAARARDVYEYMSSGRGVKRGFKKLPGEPDDKEVSLVYLERSGGLLTRAPWFESFDRVAQTEIGYIRRALQHGEKLGDKPRVALSTIHGAKGGEADHVILMKEMADRTHREMLRLPEDEARVWYVGVTRAKQKLTVVESSSRRNLTCPWI